MLCVSVTNVIMLNVYVEWHREAVCLPRYTRKIFKNILRENHRLFIGLPKLLNPIVTLSKSPKALQQFPLQWCLYLSCDGVMMTSSNGNIFRVTGLLCREFTGHRWIPRTKASDAEFDLFFDICLNKQLSKQSWDWWFETPSCSLWRQCNVFTGYGYRYVYWTFREGKPHQLVLSKFLVISNGLYRMKWRKSSTMALCYHNTPMSL